MNNDSMIEVGLKFIDIIDIYIYTIINNLIYVNNK